MQWFDATALGQLLDYPGLIAALEDAHKGQMPEARHLVMDEPSFGSNKFISLVGWAKDDVIAVKMVGVFPSNLRREPPE
ncbi:MAG TPA: ornithine cyclodeaminase, partial [Hyphomonas sp.]|nr:ornithine cyclodeaminase [Hyphomonas sp.]